MTDFCFIIIYFFALLLDMDLEGRKTDKLKSKKWLTKLFFCAIINLQIGK